MSVSGDGRLVSVALESANLVVLIDATTNRRLADIGVGKLPWGVAIR